MIFPTIIILAFVGVLTSNEALAEKRKHVICYHGTWSTYRPSLGKFDVTDIDPFLCTHLMYAFFGIEENGELRIIDPYLDLEDQGGRANIKHFNALKLQNPTLKTLAAVGGWNEGSKKFSEVANDPEKRARFVKSVVQFIQRHGFDGLDLDWEYPNQRHKLTNDDMTNFITWLKELREGLDPFGYILTAAVGSAEFSASISYNIPEVAKYLDIINVMAYDLHGPWDDVTGMNAPLYAGIKDITEIAKQLNVDAIMKYWIGQGAPKDKLVVGMPFYGRSFTLEKADQTDPGSLHVGRGIAGPYSREPGVIGYNEMCEKMLNEQWTVVWESKQMVTYAYRNQQWVGFETPRSIGLKAKYVMDNDLAGVMIWSIESDDFRGVCSSEKYPLLRQINRILFDTTATATATGLPSQDEEPSETALSSSNQYSIQEERQENKNSIPFNCHSDRGYVRDPYNCSKFYFCDIGGISYNFECPQSLQFDLLSTSCNYANLVKC